MLRPATPLTVVFVVSFALLLVASLSTPVVKSIPLGQDDDTTFGVWGFCTSEECSQIQIGYAMPDLNSTAGAFNLKPENRHTISYLLIVHPIAALFSLIAAALAGGSHLRAGSHSTTYLLCFFFITIFTFLFSLLAFVVDVLLFIPHLKFGSYLVLAGTLLNFLGTIVACGLRRTLVARKKQRKRIGENAEMSGENYYNRQAAKATLPHLESPPMSHESTSPYTEKAMGYPTTFDMKQKPTSSEDTIPLNPSNSSFRPMPLNSENNRMNSPYGPRQPPQLGVAMPYQRGRGGYGGSMRGEYPPQRGRGFPALSARGPPPPGWAQGRRGGVGGYDDGTNIDSYYESTPANYDSQQRSNNSPPNDPQPTDTYIPPRSQWSSKPGPPPTQASRLAHRALSPIQGSPISLSKSPPPNTESVVDGYLEDVDARFAESTDHKGPTSNARNPSPLGPSNNSTSTLPIALQVGNMRSNGAINSTASAIDLRNLPMRFSENHGSSNPDLSQPQPRNFLRPPQLNADTDVLASQSYEHLPLASGQRSPAALSESSHFTSVSQRGVNPNWKPPRVKRGPSREDIILGASPDFLPFSATRGRGGRGGGRSVGRGGSGLGMGSRTATMPGSLMGGGGGLGGASSSSLLDPGGGAYPSMPRRNAVAGGGRYPSPV
jgi:hypothetical protein